MRRAMATEWKPFLVPSLGLEPTSHYWLSLAKWMVFNGITVVQAIPYAVKQTKEIEDDSQAI